MKQYKNQLTTIKLNILANARMLDLCAKYNIKRYIFSSSIYTNSSEGGFYRCSKLSAEQYIIEFGKIKKSSLYNFEIWIFVWSKIRI